MEKIMRTLTNEELITNVRKAFAEGRLTAQVGGAGCVYRMEVDDKSYGCAIGVSLNDEEIAKIQSTYINTCGITTLQENHVVNFENAEFARELQRKHDNWVRYPMSPDDETYNKKKIFEEFINSWSPAVGSIPAISTIMEGF